MYGKVELGLGLVQLLFIFQTGKRGYSMRLERRETETSGRTLNYNF